MTNTEAAREIIGQRATLQNELTSALTQLRDAIATYVTAKTVAERVEGRSDRGAAATARKGADTAHSSIIAAERRVTALRARLADDSEVEVLRRAESELDADREAGIRAFLTRAQTAWEAATVALESAWALRIVCERFNQDLKWRPPANNLSAAALEDQPELAPILALQEIRATIETLTHADRIFIDQPEAALYVLRKGQTGPFMAGEVLSAVGLNVSREKLHGMVENRFLLEFR